VTLSPVMSVHDLLAAYPFLDGFLGAYHPVFGRLADPGQRETWGRMVTLAEAATAMDIAWRLFLRDLEAEVARVTGAPPPPVSEPLALADQEATGDQVVALVSELERGASLADAARRIATATAGLDDGQVAELAHRRTRRGGVGAAGLAGATLHEVQGQWPGHPVSSLRRECDRFAQLAAHLEAAVERTARRPSAEQREALHALRALLGPLDELAVQRRRLQLAWFPILGSRGGRGPSALVDERLAETLGLAETLRAAVVREDVDAVRERSRRYLAALREVLASEEELLVPLSLRALDRDDWEALGEQERAVGWALEGR
jgi:hypothetical protein